MKINKGMKRVITFVFLLALLFNSACIPGALTFEGEQPPIEPVVSGLENSDEQFLRGRFSVVNPEMTVYALSISDTGDSILFSLDSRSVNMIDDKGQLKWEFTPEGLPLSAGLTPDGRYLAVGTDQGKVYYLSEKNGSVLWESSYAGKVEQLALAENGDCLAFSLAEEDGYTLYLLDRWGTTLLSRETGPLLKLEVLSGGDLCYLEKGEDSNSLVYLRGGEVVFEEEALLASISGCGDYAVAYTGDKLNLYLLDARANPRLISTCSISAEISWLDIADKGDCIFAYSAFSGSGSNLFVFHKEGYLLWDKRIPGGSLLDISCYGERIVASSWQEYSDDFSKVLVFDNRGNILQKLEMASKIEKLALSGNGNILTLAGNDGNIFVIDIPVHKFFFEEAGVTEESEIEGEIYRPVVFDAPAGEVYLKLYFYDEHAEHLVPVNRGIKIDQMMVQTAINELVKGPRRLSNLFRTIPKDTAINISLDEGVAIIDLPEELGKLGGAGQVTGIIDSLISTVSQYPHVKGIRFLLSGEEVETLGTEGLFIDRVFPSRSPGDNTKLLYFPYCSGERYYLLPREVVQLEHKPQTPKEMVDIVLAESSFFLAEKPELIKVELLEDRIILDWTSSIKKLFPPEASPEQKALAALFVDALLLTLGENFPQDRLAFYVEGEPWQFPEEYNALNLQIRRPFYINPEQ
ncbi:MAG TPA: hypothetical protein GX004_04875 [Firmicutes bacterium]|jgi:WD40 repeat protein|nr:hypothetical protein [Bacillota bacterium]